MKINERLQASQFLELLDRVQQCIGQIKQKINMFAENEQLRKYLKDNVFVLLENRIQVSSEQKTRHSLQQSKELLSERSEGFCSFVEKALQLKAKKKDIRQKASLLEEAITQLRQLLEVPLVSHSEFDYNFIQKQKTINAVKDLVQAVKEKDKEKLVSAAKVVTEEVKKIEEKDLECNEKEKLKRETSNLLALSKQIFQEKMKEEEPLEEEVEDSVEERMNPVIESIERNLNFLAEDEQERRRKLLLEKKVFGMLPNSIKNLALVMQGENPKW